MISCYKNKCDNYYKSIIVKSDFLFIAIYLLLGIYLQ